MKVFNSQIEFVKDKNSFLNSLKNETVIMVLNTTEVVYGADNSCNTKWCKEHNIPYAHKPELPGGGCIVGVKGNIFLDVKRLNVGGECLSDKFSKALCEFLKQKGLNSVRQDNNDVLVDGFKVASGCESATGKWLYMGYQISINQDIELIKNICSKPMLKVPKGLGDYGITTEQMLEFCKEYWSNN